MGKRSHDKAAEVFRAKVRQLLSTGHSIAQIAKLTGKSYKHTKLIAEQEKDNVRETR